MIQATAPQTRYFSTMEIADRFVITEVAYVDEITPTFTTDRKSAWMQARSQAKPVTFVDLDGVQHDLGIVCDQKPQSAPAPRRSNTPADPGFYQVGETIYKVKLGRDSGRAYALELTGVYNGKMEWELARGMVFKLTEADRLTSEAAKAFGDLYHFCLCCGRELTNPESIERGIGPICAGKYGI